MGQAGQGAFRAASGVETRVLFGSLVINQRLELTYANITEAQARLFDNHHVSVKGTFEAFKLPSQAFAGMSNAFGTYVNKWRYRSSPKIVSVKNGVHTVTVSLVAVTS
tara:strand:- start:24 stop:347 length:324 start_codon:yes stop_codon:yes gene_type:complete